MSKQINFYATESDKVTIANVLNSVFGELLDVPYNKDLLSLFDYRTNKQMFYLAERNRQKEIFYRIHEYYDGSFSEILDFRKSPVLEYSLSFKNIEENYYIGGRFYCCSDNAEFSRKVSIFFTKFKKEFLYVKKWKHYISKNIDIENSLFFISNRTIKISKEDLKIK